jgi:hypothetical protein
MKRILQSIAAVLLSGIIMVSCSPENVAPKEDNSGNPSLAGATGDPHPALDTLCQESDTLWLAREDNGSVFVDKCFGFGGVPITCAPGQPHWGGLVLREGYIANENVVDCNFWMAPGWYCDFNTWQFGVGTFSFDQNGVPLVNNDWGSLIVNPVQNKWQLRLEVGNLPSPEFDLALRVTAVRLNLFGAVTPGSSTVLWGKNMNWNDLAHPAHSTSPWLMHFTPLRCLETATPVVPSCVSLFTSPLVTNCATISANTTGLNGSFSYSWSTGATTQSISVCPTATTTYTVTISSVGGGPVRINQITVNTASAACGNGSNAGQKVMVCHVPPGNPSNVQDICIAPSALPAHVLRFRLPGSNPHQGHDSGCEIGRCGVNLCL